MPKFLEISKCDWHWLAGIWEGEGTACITTQVQRHPFKNGLRLVVTISQKDRSMLDEVRRITKTGSIHYATRASVWIIASRSAREFLGAILPYIRSDRKRTQAEFALRRDAQERERGKASLIASNRRRALHA
jgi:hypothetical protein